ncbi:MAG: class I poly(R)-hydroxyalkanoic acid synthase, partial [Aromatoleum sp.]|nr:class I poly(R)-hydroxyalkanoic acid synthase [Aromatoleum sp.]
MNPHAAPPENQPWLELAGRWQQIGQEWTNWWTHAGSGAAAIGTGVGACPAMPSPPAGLVPDTVDPDVLSKLNAKYQPRIQALWTAAQAALVCAPDGQAQIANVVESPPGDRRFAAPEWSALPFFALMKQSYLLNGEYLNELAALAPVPEPDRKRLAFMTRQYVDAMAPTNFPATNPEVLKRAVATEGASLAQGLANLMADAQRGRISMSDERAFAIGRNLAVTPGDVVFRSDLIELIQYAPTTKQVFRRPLLIVPPCINKYYILDLQPQNSFVRWAVAEGHTVFMLSWRNVPPELGHLTWDDYLEQGPLTAIRVAREIAGSATVNALGFCVGGTLLASALALLAARKDRSVESTTLLTTMLDFEDPGEIGVYISREFLASRESALMSGQRVHGSELAGAFASLRANDLVWNYVVNNYLKGATPPAFDLLHWNCDSSNLPGPMYVYYLKNMYLDNRLREPGALTMAGETIDLGRVTMPTYVYASRDDHIVPWRAAYRTTALFGGDLAFVMGASGHIAGVVNPPEKKRRNYWTNDLLTDDPDDWFARAHSIPGSWWPHWAAWLEPHGGARRPAPHGTGSDDYPPLASAP